MRILNILIDLSEIKADPALALVLKTTIGVLNWLVEQVIAPISEVYQLIRVFQPKGNRFHCTTVHKVGP